MGKEKYVRNVEALFSKSPVVSHSSIEKILRHKKKTNQYTNVLIHNLLAKGRIKRLSKGYYTAYDDTALAVFCFQPAYLGLQDALSFHNLWEQETIPVIITSRKVRSGIRNILGQNVLIRRIRAKYFFGIEYSQEGNVAMPYSDIEKTFLDMIYFKEKISDEVISAFRKKINPKKLRVYLKFYPKKTRKLAASKFRQFNLQME